MNENLKVKALEGELSLLEKAINVLRESYDNCSKIIGKSEYDNHDLIEFEAFCSRFGRASDIFIQKVLRIIDLLELEPEGSVRDRINRAEKRNFVEKAETLVNIRELRNDIEHE